MSRRARLRRRGWRLGAELTLTTLFWGAWVYLVTPLLSLLLWIVGIYIFVEQMVGLGGYETVLQRLGDYLAVVFLILLAMAYWIHWNMRFGGEGNKRTRQPAEVTAEETAQFLGTTAAAIRQLQARRSVTVDFGDGDRLVEVKR